MRIETNTFVYNEEFLLPFYLKHYDWVDQMNIVYDVDSTDGTIEILQSNYKVNTIPFKFPDGMDDSLKVKKLNELYAESKADIVLNVDCDEFLFNPSKIKEKALLHPVVNIQLYDVYRNVDESDLDINKTIKEQRSHGTFDPFYNKPIIVTTGLDLRWKPGNHELEGGLIRTDCGLVGAHWANADPCFCVDRRIKNRKERQSKMNLACHMTLHNHHIKAEDVIKQCEDHKNDKSVW